MSTQVITKTSLVGQARACLNSNECMELYEKWAATYNDDVGDEAQNYVAPVIVANTVITLSNSSATSLILDAGCGTGLVGQALAIAGAKTIDGIDLSPAMLKVASKTGVYRNLDQADLTKPIEKADNTYDVVTCVGTFTLGHVGPDPALREFVRIVKQNGTVAATILTEIWVSQKFDAEVEKLKEEGLVTVLAEERIDYVKGHGDKAILVILQKN